MPFDHLFEYVFHRRLYKRELLKIPHYILKDRAVKLYFINVVIEYNFSSQSLCHNCNFP